MVLKSLGTFHLVKIFRNLGLVENGKRFVCSSPWKIPGKSGKSKKVGPFSWAELSNRISCSIYTFLILYTSFDKLFPTRQHLVVSSGNQLGAVPGFTIKWNNFLPTPNPFLLVLKFPESAPWDGICSHLYTRI